MKNRTLFVTNLLLFFVFSCGRKSTDSNDFSPKPKGYNRIDLPAVGYQKMLENHPYNFEYSKYAQLLPDTFARAEPHWIYIDYPELDANVQLTYKPVNGDLARLQSMIGDARKLSFKHNVKAYSIQEKIYTSPNGKKANIIDLEGEVPSQVQFYMTDSSKHFLRGALYFKTSTQNDSLAPVIQYIRKDIIHLVNTLKWQK